MIPLIQRLSDGSWLFDELVPPFLNKLANSERLSFLKGRPVPSYVATLAYYRVLPEDAVLEALDVAAFDGRAPAHPGSRTVWSRLARTVSEQSSLAELTEAQRAILLNCWSELANLNVSHGREFANIVNAMIPLEDSGFGAASTPRLFGCIFITRRWLDQSFEKRMTSLIHELAHQELFLVNLVDRLVHSSSDYSLAHAPLQGTERPPIGRLHSAHALFRMRNLQMSAGWEHTETNRLLAETCRSFTGDELTPFAAEIVSKVYAA